MPPSLEEVIHLPTDKLDALFNCDELKDFWQSCRQRYLTLTAQVTKIQKEANSNSTIGGAICLGLGVLGAAIGFPDLLSQAPLDLIADGIGAVGTALGGGLLARDQWKKTTKKQGTKDLQANATELDQFLSRCREVMITKKCPEF